jgi:hypothetical protein
MRIFLFLLAVGGAIGALFPMLSDAFMANPALNGLIVGVLLVGIALNVRQVLILGPEVDWIESVKRQQTQLSNMASPRLLSPLANMISEQKDMRRMMISAPAARSILDGIGARLEESRDTARYFIGLSVFLGLLGTFWGLLGTVDTIATVIRDLELTGNDITDVFNTLKHNLNAPLSSMGTAFASSLLGLAGSLILGFLDLQTGQAQNSFYGDVEEWMSGITKISSGTGALAHTDGETSVPMYIQALLEQTADSLEELQRIMARGEEGRLASQSQIATLAENIAILTDQMRAEQSVLLRMAESLAELKPVFTHLAEGPQTNDPTVVHLRNLDNTLNRMLADNSSGREQVIRELRNEIKVLSRTIAATASHSTDYKG